MSNNSEDLAATRDSYRQLRELDYGRYRQAIKTAEMLIMISDTADYKRASKMEKLIVNYTLELLKDGKTILDGPHSGSIDIKDA